MVQEENNKYSELSDVELRQLLLEIENDSEDIKCDEQNLESISDTKVDTSNNARLEKINIQRAAFSQSNLRLSDQMQNSDFKLLIELLTDTYSAAMDKYRAHIENRLTKLLKPLIPHVLKACKEKFPQSIRKSPGFLYVASEEYGHGARMWVSPDIPYFIEQGHELKLIEKTKPGMLCTVDRSVYMYNKYKSLLQSKEIYYAEVLISKKVNTYYDLLKLNPMWFKKLYEFKFSQLC